MNIANSSEKDLKNLACCHRSAFPKSLSSKLGLNYCMKMLSWYIEDNRGELFHLEESGKILGYCGCIKITMPGKYGSATSIFQYSFKVLIISLIIRPWLICHPEVIRRLPFIWRNIKIKLGLTKSNYKLKNDSYSDNFMPSMGLVVIGVLPEFQGKGYGSLLLQEFEKRAREKGFRQVHLSVKKDNKQAISVYLKNGWKIGSSREDEISMFKSLL